MDLPAAAPQPPKGNRSVDERDTLIDMLEFYRTVLIRKTWDLAPDQLHAAPLPSTLTLGRLLAHMAFVEDHWFGVSLAGRAAFAPWDRADFDHDADWEMTWGEDQSHDQLLALFGEAVDRSRTIVEAEPRLGTTGKGATGQGVSLRWILVHMIEEYARHVGHADMLREALDGQTGD